MRAVVEYGVLRFARRRADRRPADEVALALPGAVAFGAWELARALEPAARDAARPAPADGPRRARRRRASAATR